MPPSMAEVLNGGAGRITTLRQGLNVELAFIQRTVKQGTESTATQMKDYLVNLGKKIQGEVHHAGMEGIREQLVASFKQIGWDLAQNEPAGDLPTLKDLEKWLSGRCAQDASACAFAVRIAGLTARMWLPGGAPEPRGEESFRESNSSGAAGLCSGVRAHLVARRPALRARCLPPRERSQSPALTRGAM
eukprot:2031391-Rhodomonas_salina.1